MGGGIGRAAVLGGTVFRGTTVSSLGVANKDFIKGQISKHSDSHLCHALK